jgi:biopolymer transport protein ExbB
MIEMFLDILTAGVGDANRLAGGIGQALISTAAGLCVAIPALMFHRYLRGRVTGYVVDMEKQATALLDALEEGASPPPPRPARAAKRSDA